MNLNRDELDDGMTRMFVFILSSCKSRFRQWKWKKLVCPLTLLLGLWKEYGKAPGSKEIDEMRKEVWRTL